MKVNNKKATLKILNHSAAADKRIIPSFNHILIEGVAYPLIMDLSKVPEQSNDENYLSYEVIVSGTIFPTTGYMPNPVIKRDVFKVEDVLFKK